MPNDLIPNFRETSPGPAILFIDSCFVEEKSLEHRDVDSPRTSSSDEIDLRENPKDSTISSRYSLERAARSRIFLKARSSAPMTSDDSCPPKIAVESKNVARSESRKNRAHSTLRQNRESKKTVARFIS